MYITRREIDNCFVLNRKYVERKLKLITQLHSRQIVIVLICKKNFIFSRFYERYTTHQYGTLALFINAGSFCINLLV